MKLPRKVALVLLLLVSCREATQVRAPDDSKPQLFLLTPLPLLWSEQFGLEQPGSRVLQGLEQAFEVTPVDLPSQLPRRALLLAAQPRALPAAELVKLDAWVRGGGRMLLLADPVLEWPSQLPLGDPGRPPMTFADTGLLHHWGLRLDAPDDRGPRQVPLGEHRVLASSPGTLVALGDACLVADGGLLARCRLGKGKATIIADADFLNLGPTGVDGPTEQNLPALVSQLLSLSR